MTDAYYARSAFPSGGARYTISSAAQLTSEAPAPSWISKIAQRLEELGNLPENWDSYGAPSIDASVIQAAMDALDSVRDLEIPAPQVTPTARGGIQFEWNLTHFEAELEFVNIHRAEWWACDPQSDAEEEDELSLIDLRALRMKLRRLARGG